jgi:hypothetical protein
MLIAILKNFTSCAELLHETIVADFDDQAYPLLVKKYVAVQQVYDICLSNFQHHLDNVRQQRERQVAKDKRTSKPEHLTNDDTSNQNPFSRSQRAKPFAIAHKNTSINKTPLIK